MDTCASATQELKVLNMEKQGNIYKILYRLRTFVYHAKLLNRQNDGVRLNELPWHFTFTRIGH
jgi:hypothetical protein